MSVHSICDSVVAIKKCANVSKTSENIDEKRKEVHENLFVCAINDLAHSVRRERLLTTDTLYKLSDRRVMR